MAHSRWVFAATVLFTLLPVGAVVGGIAACSSDSNSASADSGAGAQCAAQPTFIECQSCCGVTDSYGKGQTALENCLCDEACTTECASNACSTAANAPPATDACKACLDSDKASSLCKPKAQAICDADPACKQFQACKVAAKCDDKPDDVDGG